MIEVEVLLNKENMQRRISGHRKKSSIMCIKNCKDILTVWFVCLLAPFIWR